jgi:hypothetical protein
MQVELITKIKYNKASNRRAALANATADMRELEYGEKVQTFVGAEPKQTSELAIPLYRFSVPQNVPDLVPVYRFC